MRSAPRSRLLFPCVKCVIWMHIAGAREPWRGRVRRSVGISTGMYQISMGRLNFRVERDDNDASLLDLVARMGK